MTAATVKRAYTTLRCAICNRRLKSDHYVRSVHTGSRYCWPGEGCNK